MNLRWTADFGEIEVHRASGDWLQVIEDEWRGQVIRGEWLVVTRN